MVVRSAESSLDMDRIRIATPCPINWDQMTGDNRVRFCDHCQLNVYNIAELSRREAENLIIATEGRLCARIYRRTDGTLLTKDCPVGLRALRLRFSKKAAAVLAAVVSLAAAALGQQPVAQPEKASCTPTTRVTHAETTSDHIDVISGTARDSAGGVIPGAKVTVTNEETREAGITSANAAGRFEFSSLVPGRYTLRIESIGFQTHEITNVMLEKGKSVDLDTIVELSGEPLSGIVDVSSMFKTPLPPPGTTIISGEMIRRLPIQK